MKKPRSHPDTQAWWRRGIDDFAGQRDRTGTIFLRFVAIVLIANSHLDAFWPVPSLATGGAIGNSLFFMLSGYGLFLSASTQRRPFLVWYGRRVVRIYPALLIVSIVFFLVAQSAWRDLGWLGYVQMFIWPTRYWFIGALMIFYLVFFVMLQLRNRGLFLVGIALLYVPYLYFYLTALDLSAYSIEGPGYFKWIFYLQAMFFGGYLAARGHPGKSSLWRDGAALVLVIALHYGILSLMSRFGGWQFQAVTHLLMFPALFFFSRLAFNERITALVQSRYLGLAICLIASATLEIYLLHGHIRAFQFMLGVPFPLNLVVFWVVTVVLAYILGQVSRLAAAWCRLEYQK